jgi:outer membrane usher protein
MKPLDLFVAPPWRFNALAMAMGIGAFLSCAHAAKPKINVVEEDRMLSAMTWVEARTIQSDQDLPLWVRLEGDASQGQVLQLEQKGLIIYEQQLREGAFRIREFPPVDPSAPLTVRLKSPNQADEQAVLPLKPQQKRELYAKRPQLLALAPATVAKPLGDKQLRGAMDEDVEFDLDFLRGKAFRNLSPSEVKRLGTVRAGSKVDADIYRNNNLVSKSNVLFTKSPNSDKVQACITPELFQQMGVKTAFISAEGLQMLKSVADKTTPQAAANCLPIDQWVAGATSEFDNSDLRLDLTIAQAFLTRQNKQSVPPEMLTRGENAGFINYNLNNYTASDFKSNYLGLNTGINVGGWQLRHASYLSQNTAKGVKTNQYVAGETSVKRPLVSIQASLALGDISSNSPIIGSTPLRGVRLSSEENMMPDQERSFRPVIRGVARTNARVRISQNKVVFFEQTVPPGPFEFDEINPISSVGELQVVIAEADGTQQTFVVPYSQSAGKLNPGSFRYSIATGLFRNYTSVQQTNVLQAYVRYGLNSFLSPGVEVLVGPNYSNIGVQASLNSEMGALSFNTLFSHFDSPTLSKPNGFAQNINYNTPSLGALGFYAGLATQSLRYTTPSNALNNSSSALFTNDSFKNNAFLGLNLNLQQWGGLNLSASQQRSWQEVGSQQYRVSYGNTIKLVNFNIGLDHTTYTDRPQSVDSISLSASIPLGWGSNTGGLRAGYSQNGTATPTESLNYFGYAPVQQLSYNLGHSQTGEFGSSNASANMQHRYGGLGATLSSATGGSRQYGLNASGGIVLHSGGVILAPTLGETFAIVEVPQGEGASVLGSSGRINRGGYGVVPYLSPYYQNDVQISLEGVSAEVDIDNVNQKVAPVEGSIVRLKFKATTGRPLVIVLQTMDGARVPIGASVTDSEGAELGTVGQGSRAMVRVQKTKDRLKVVWGEKPEETCWVTYALDEKQKANASGFTNLKLRCEVLGVSEKTAQSQK